MDQGATTAAAVRGPMLCVRLRFAVPEPHWAPLLSALPMLRPDAPRRIG